MDNLLKMKSFKIFIIILVLAIISDLFKLPSGTKLDGVHLKFYLVSTLVCGLFTLGYAFKVLGITEKEEVKKKTFILFSLIVTSLILLPNVLKLTFYYLL